MDFEIWLMITKNPFPPALFPIPRYKKKGKLVILLMEYSRGVFKLFFIKTLGPSFPRLFQLGLFLSTEVKQYLTGRLLRADYCGELKGKSWHLCASLIFEGRKALAIGPNAHMSELDFLFSAFQSECQANISGSSRQLEGMLLSHVTRSWFHELISNSEKPRTIETGAESCRHS